MATKDHSGKNEVAFQRAFGAGVGCDGPLRTKARNHPGTRGRKPAAPAPRFAAYPVCLRALPQLLEGGSTHSSRVRNHDNEEIRFDSRLASVDGVLRRRRPSRTRDSLWGPLDPALLPGVDMIETPWCRETIVRHSPCRSCRLRAAVV